MSTSHFELGGERYRVEKSLVVSQLWLGERLICKVRGDGEGAITAFYRPYSRTEAVPVGYENEGVWKPVEAVSESCFYPPSPSTSRAEDMFLKKLGYVRRKDEYTGYEVGPWCRVVSVLKEAKPASKSNRGKRVVLKVLGKNYILQVDETTLKIKNRGKELVRVVGRDGDDSLFIKCGEESCRYGLVGAGRYRLVRGLGRAGCTKLELKLLRVLGVHLKAAGEAETGPYLALLRQY